VRTKRAKFLENEAGATAVVFALGLTVFIGLGALTLDIGRAWNLDTELQNAADAAALACASQLDHKAGARARGRQAAMAGGLVQNRQTLATDGGGNDVTFAVANIRFLVDLATRAVATTDADANYCEVTTNRRRIDFSFAQLLINTGSVSPRAVATAELSIARCRIPPILICNPDEPNPFNASGRIGFGMTLKDGVGGGLAPGNFGYLALPADPNPVLSANAIRDAWARLRPLHACFTRFVTSKPGQTTAVKQGFNMRFDIYPTGTHQVPAGELPVQDNVNYSPDMNNVKGLVKAGPSCDYQHPQGWNKTAQPYQGAPPADGMGFPRDACAYNGGSCDTTTGGSNFGDGVWDIVTYFAVNHPLVNPATIPALVPQLDSVPTISRFEVYQWELATGQLSTGVNETPQPICHTNPQAVSPQRRIVTAAVVNCNALAGKTTIEPEAWVDFFLPEPMGVLDSNNDLYLEVIGPSGNGQSEVVRHILRLVE